MKSSENRPTTIYPTPIPSPSLFPILLTPPFPFPLPFLRWSLPLLILFPSPPFSPPPYGCVQHSNSFLPSFLIFICQGSLRYIFFVLYTQKKMWFHCVMGWETQRNHTSIVFFFLQNKKIHNESMISLCFSTHNTMKMYFPCIFLGVEKLHNRIMILLFFRGKKKLYNKLMIPLCIFWG